MALPKRAVAGLITLALSLVTASVALAHDFWLIPEVFRVDVGQEQTVLGRTSSSFPTSLSAVTVDRVADARVLAADGERELTRVDVVGTSLRLRHRPHRPGQQVVAVRVHPRDVRESPESFRRYLELEGAPEALARYERAGLLPTDSIVRRYAKYAKAIVEVGTDGPRAFARPAGHPLEFLPLDDPAMARPGETLRFRLLLEGESVPDAPMHAGIAQAMGDEAPVRDTKLTTDENGMVEVTIAEPGIWNVRTLVIVPAPDSSTADWDVHWATLVFEIAP